MPPALRYRDFRLLLASSFLSYSSVWMQRLVVGWLMLKLTDSPVFVGVAFAARALPHLLLGAFAGTISDRMNRKHLVIGVQVWSAALSMAMAMLVLLQDVTPWQAIAFSFLYGTVQTFDLPARQALVCDLTGREVLMNALSLNEISRRATSVLGPLLGGLLIDAIGMGGVFLSMAGMSGLGLMAMLPLRAPMPVAPPAPQRGDALRRLAGNLLVNLVDGVRVIGRNQVTLALVFLVAACEVFAFSYAAMMPIFVERVLHLEASGYGYLTAAVGMGSLLGAIGLASLGEYRHKGWLMSVAFFFFGAFLLGFSASTWFELSLLLLVGVGAVACAFDTLTQTLLQQNVPEAMRGRAMGAWVLAIGMGPVGTLYLGLVADRLGAPLAVGANAAVVCLMALAVLAGMSRIRRLP